MFANITNRKVSHINISGLFLTLCGLDLRDKKSIYWTQARERRTCKNCLLKLL